MSWTPRFEDVLQHGLLNDLYDPDDILERYVRLDALEHLMLINRIFQDLSFISSSFPGSSRNWIAMLRTSMTLNRASIVIKFFRMVGPSKSSTIQRTLIRPIFQ